MVFFPNTKILLRCEINIKPIKIYVPHKSHGGEKFSGNTGIGDP